MAAGEVRPCAFLDGKGKLLAVCQMLTEGDSVWLSTQDHLVDFLAEMLERFHFTEDLAIEAPSGLVCADVVSLQPIGGPDPGSGDRTDEGLVRLAGRRDSIHWLRCHGPRDRVLSWVSGQVPAASAETSGCLRFLLREPRVGADSEPNTLALEWPIRDHISTDKGCYTGQEVVARIHTYGHTNRSLCLLRVDGGGPIEASTAIVETEDGDAVGRVMTAASLPEAAGSLAFGFLPSDFTAPGTRLALATQDGPEVLVL